MPNAPTDPNVTLPAAVRLQSEQAEALHKSIYNPEAPDPNAPPAQPDPNAPPAQPEQVTLQVTDQPPAEEQPPQRSPTVENGSWEQKYWSINSRYQAANTTIQSLNLQLVTERENTQALRGMLATMQPEQPADAQQRGQSLLTDQERQDYGEDLLGVVGKRSREEFGPVVTQLQNEILSLKQQLQGVGRSVAVSEQQQMFAFLDKKRPDWRDLNHNPQFISWLGLHDPLSGAKRHDMLKEAFEANNSPRVLAFFDSYQAPAVGSGQSQQAAPPPAKTPLQNLAAPGRANTAAQQAPVADKPVYTQDQIQRFYADVTAGRYRGREDEKDAVERDIFLAQKEGRIK